MSTPTVLKCPTCRTFTPIGWDYCGKCGGSMRVAQGAEAWQQGLRGAGRRGLGFTKKRMLIGLGLFLFIVLIVLVI